ncbi:hypothetical protein HRG84_07180 [Flavisolibacter sp. BT320]|nr:hypothetical protein [Flavisolibacter longurius]
MFKQTLLTCFLMAALFCGTSAQAQGGPGYSTGLGMRFEFGDGNLYGFSAKHFFSQQMAGEATLLFGTGINAALGAELQYHVPIPSATGLSWYAGGGVQALFAKYDAGTFVGLRPIGGLDYKVASAPVNLSFDWRPTFWLNQGGGSNIGRFGLALRFTL